MDESSFVSKINSIICAQCSLSKPPHIYYIYRTTPSDVRNGFYFTARVDDRKVNLRRDLHECGEIKFISDITSDGSIFIQRVPN